VNVSVITTFCTQTAEINIIFDAIFM